MVEQTIKRFDIKTDTKLIKALSKVLKEEKNCLTEEKILLRDSVLVTDDPNIMAIIALTDEAKLILRRFISDEDNRSIPILNFENTYSDISKVRIASDYLKEAITILNCLEDSVVITAKKDYPLMLENKHFRILIAPRIDND